jgi:hypothetical protein
MINVLKELSIALPFCVMEFLDTFRPLAYALSDVELLC